MGIGFIISMGVMFVWMGVILAVTIPMEKKYIIRSKGKIDYKKTELFLRWNVFDTLTVILAVYTIICVQVLNLMISSGATVENPYVQFFTNQAQAWTIVVILYLFSRLSRTLKSVHARMGEAS
ncbi:group-specific protein [Halobacillus litoralis]|uniref:Group-specific protein n=1 Tax=Halobacillus litoralis TaxID=45668 RepID=A0A845DN16_9BACI|nr:MULTISPECIES: group-specific protein [Halobacillus]MYL18628.1 group-specific protein [Halobacillus litoralis]MYL31623.1 group-specific protein [Halobacillus halophilus]MYL39069.1 group-specific protein [Halobacillus litoralis]